MYCEKISISYKVCFDEVENTVFFNEKVFFNMGSEILGNKMILKKHLSIPKAYLFYYYFIYLLLFTLFLLEKITSISQAF